MRVKKLLKYNKAWDDDMVIWFEEKCGSGANFYGRKKKDIMTNPELLKKRVVSFNGNNVRVQTLKKID